MGGGGGGLAELLAGVALNDDGGRNNIFGAPVGLLIMCVCATTLGTVAMLLAFPV